MGWQSELLDFFVNEQDPGCEVTPVLVSMDHCAPCEDLKAQAAEMEGVDIQVVDVNSADGVELMEKAGLDMVPQLLLVDCEGEIVKQLNLEDADEDEPHESPVAEPDDLEVMKSLIVDNIRRMAVRR